LLYLLPFPTRRSSDLRNVSRYAISPNIPVRILMESIRCRCSVVTGSASETTQWHDAVVLYRLVHTGQDTHRIYSVRSRPRVHPRSEEHTSELQSRFDL